MRLCKKISKSFLIIEDVLGKRELYEFAICDEEKVPLYYFDLSLWITNNILRDGEEVYILLKNCGFKSREEMSQYIMLLFHSYIREKYKKEKI